MVTLKSSIQKGKRKVITLTI